MSIEQCPPPPQRRGSPWLRLPARGLGPRPGHCDALLSANTGHNTARYHHTQPRCSPPVPLDCAERTVDCQWEKSPGTGDEQHSGVWVWEDWELVWWSFLSARGHCSKGRGLNVIGHSKLGVKERELRTVKHAIVKLFIKIYFWWRCKPIKHPYYNRLYERIISQGAPTAMPPNVLQLSLVDLHTKSNVQPHVVENREGYAPSAPSATLDAPPPRTLPHTQMHTHIVHATAAM